MLTINKVLSNKENTSVVNYLNRNKYSPTLNFLSDDQEIEVQKLNIGTHPDMIELLWYTYTTLFPVKCQMIFLGRPALINPDTGVVFGIAEGTNPLLLRLSKIDIDALLKKGGRILLSDMNRTYADAQEVGNDWIYCYSFIENLETYFLKAYNFSGSL